MSPARHAEWTRRQQAIRDGDAQASADQRTRADFGAKMDALGIPEDDQPAVYTRLEEKVKAQEAKTGEPATQKVLSSFSKKLQTGYSLRRPDGHGYIAGRDGSIVPTGKERPGGIGSFIDDHIPAGHTFAVNHDKLVDWLTKEHGVPDLVANVPTMLTTYLYSLVQELVNESVSEMNSAYNAGNEIPFVHTDPKED